MQHEESTSGSIWFMSWSASGEVGWWPGCRASFSINHSSVASDGSNRTKLPQGKWEVGKGEGVAAPATLVVVVVLVVVIYYWLLVLPCLLRDHPMKSSMKVRCLLM